MMLSPLALNSLAIAYVIATYGLGVGLLILHTWQLNLLGVILLLHALVLSATFTHEFIHGNIFTMRSLNFFWGKVMTHLNGACYATWDGLVEHHFNHHLHHADFIEFDIDAHFKQMNPWLRRLYIVLEWLYFPALEFELRWRIILTPFTNPQKHHLIGRAIALMLYRTLAFGILAWLSIKAVLLYAIAYISFVNVMRFADAFHHTYDYVIVGHEFPKRDRVYEQEHTFSNLVSIRHPWLNLLFLNFGYHNAHHHNMSCPWYELPNLHHKLYRESGGGLLPLSQLVKNYHQFRLYRLSNGQGDFKLELQSSSNAFIGGIAVSFLTPPQTY
jgi:fatty acid desaturase